MGDAWIGWPRTGEARCGEAGMGWWGVERLGGARAGVIWCGKAR